MIVRELLTKWGIKVDDKQLKALDKRLDSVKKSFDGAGDKAIQFGKSLSLFVTAPIVGAGLAMTKLAADAEETENKFAEIFKGIGPQAEGAADDLSKSFGIANSTSKELLSSTGDLLVGLGMNREEALKMSKEVVALSGDLASFKNVQGGTARASNAITKALLGEREMLKDAIGTAVLEADVTKKVNELKAKGVKGTDQQVKALATLRIITERNTDAIGDFARTSEKSVSVQTKILTEDFKDLAISFGQILLPIALKLTKMLRRAIAFFKGLSASTKKYILIVGGIVAALGPALIVFGLVLKSLGAIIGVIKVLIPFITGLKIASIGLAAIWLGLFAAIFLVAEDIIAFFQGRKSLTGSIVRFFKEELPGFTEALVSAFRLAQEVAKIFFKIISENIENLKPLLKFFVGVWKFIGETILKSIRQQLMIIGETLKMLERLGVFKFVSETLGGAAGFLSGLGGGQTPEGARAGGGGGMSTTQINMENKITVPPGTPPELVGSAIERGVKKSTDEMLRQTHNVVAPQVVS